MANMHVGIKGLNAWVIKTNKQKDRIKKKATDYVKFKATQVLRAAVLNTPQWTGQTAASWELVIDGGSPFFNSLHKDSRPYEFPLSQRRFNPSVRFKGNAKTYVEAKNHNEMFYMGVKWNSKISLVNSSPRAGWLVAGQGETIKSDHISDYKDVIPEWYLRPGNFIPGDVMALQYLQNKFKFLNKS
jgi:hypothetical protein